MLCVHSFLPNGIFFWVLGRSRPTNTNRKKGKPTPFLPKRTETMMMQQQILPNFASASFQGVRSSPPAAFSFGPNSQVSSPLLFSRRGDTRNPICAAGKERKEKRENGGYLQPIIFPPYLFLSFSLGRDREEGKKRKEKERLTAGAPRGDALWMEKRGKGYGEKEIR